MTDLVERVARGMCHHYSEMQGERCDDCPGACDQWDCEIGPAKIAIAIVLKEAAKVAKGFGDTVPNLEKSDNSAMAFAMAAVMSETGEQIAAAIRALGEDDG